MQKTAAAAAVMAHLWVTTLSCFSFRVWIVTVTLAGDVSAKTAPKGLQ